MIAQVDSAKAATHDSNGQRLNHAHARRAQSRRAIALKKPARSDSVEHQAAVEATRRRPLERRKDPRAGRIIERDVDLDVYALDGGIDVGGEAFEERIGILEDLDVISTDGKVAGDGCGLHGEVALTLVEHGKNCLARLAPRQPRAPRFVAQSTLAPLIDDRAVTRFPLG